MSDTVQNNNEGLEKDIPLEFENVKASNQQGEDKDVCIFYDHAHLEKISEKEPDEKNDKKLKWNALVFSILGLTALTNTAYAIIAPFLPFKFEEKHIDASWIGYVFSSYSIAVIVFSPLCGSIIRLTGRINLIILGVNLMGLSFIAFGLISSVKEPNLFIALSLLARFLQGMASGLI
jgi:predicted MFS family arabinose efflux permease